MVRKPISKLLRYCLIVNLIIPFFISSNNILTAQDWDYEEDVAIEKEAQEQLAAMLQWSARYQFGKDLKVGDRVEYKIIGDDKNNTEVELEVTKEERGGVWIVEKFEGNEVHMLVDLKTMTLLDLFGYDEEGNKQEPVLLNDTKVYEKIQETTNIIKVYGSTTRWNEVKEQETVKTPVGYFECSYLEPLFSESISKDMTSEQLGELKNEMRFYFSKVVPKMLPFLYVAVPAIVSSDSYKDVDKGFVKNMNIELIDYSK